MIVYAPRKVTLAPHEPQAIRIAARAAAGPARRRISRAHAVPRDSAGDAGGPADWRAAERRPVQADADLRRHHPGHRPARQPPGERWNRQRPAREARTSAAAVGLDLTRTGSRSTYGEVRVLKAGVKDPIAVQKGRRGLYRSRPAPRQHPRSPRRSKAAAAGRGDGRISRNLRRRHASARPDRRRCSARRATGSAERVRWPAAAPGCARRRCCWRSAPAASAASAPLAAPARPQPWTADPDEQFILDVNIHQLRLGDTVRAYNPPEGTCVVLGDFLTALDVPMRIDLAAKKASGWAFKESNKITIDYGALQASYGDEERSDRARHDPRDAGRLVRPDQRARPLVRDQRQADDRRDRC